MFVLEFYDFINTDEYSDPITDMITDHVPPDGTSILLKADDGSPYRKATVISQEWLLDASKTPRIDMGIPHIQVCLHIMWDDDT